MTSIITILPKIIKATEARKITWTQNQRYPIYEAELAGKQIKCWEWKDDDTGDPGFSASISMIGSEEPIDVAVADKYSDDYELLKSAFVAARRSSKGVDVVVHELDQALDGLLEDDFPF